MTAFFITIIFFGISITLFSWFLIYFDWIKGKDYAKLLDEKKTDLINIIEDADSMINELNKYSDYLLENIETRSNKINKEIFEFDEKLKNKSLLLAGETNPDYIDNIIKLDINKSKRISNTIVYGQGLNLQNKVIEKSQVNEYNAKQNKVLELFENGMECSDIAKKLGLGKGEIQLILKKNKKETTKNENTIKETKIQ